MKLESWSQVKTNLDVKYAYQFAKSIEQFRCHPILGYRSAGSQAEKEAGQFIEEEMKKIGLSKVMRDAVTLDSWTFRKAHLSFEIAKGQLYHCELGAYQTHFDTKGEHSFSLVYLNKGLAKDYETKDVRGKLVLIDINQRDEWWINYPVYQAYLKGAAAVLAVQVGGYGQVYPEALNAQDIAGPSQAAAFSISKKDAEILKSICKFSGEIQVHLDAQSIVETDQLSYNIVGEIPGKHPEMKILFSGHYDSYFSGFQDDNVAIGMLLGIAKAAIKSGYKPYYSWVFVAMAAEEWGVVNSKYDWSTGAYEEVFHVHPDWHTQTIVDFNFELPAYAHGQRDYIRSIYEYQSFIKGKLKGIQPPIDVYPQGIGVISPIVTWSDDFSMAINGIPSVVNDFSSGKFMETHYHSQFDNESIYNEKVYAYHHELYLQLALQFDQLMIMPFNFKTFFNALKKSCSKLHEEDKKKDFLSSLEQAIKMSERVTKEIKRINKLGNRVLAENQIRIQAFQRKCSSINRKLLILFKESQDEWVKLNWHDEVKFPHTLINENLCAVNKAILALIEKDINSALRALYKIDNNRYAFLFEKQVYDYFTQYVVDQPMERLKWGYGRIMPHENLFTLVQELKTLKAQKAEDYSLAINLLKEVEKHQKELLSQSILEQIKQLNTMNKSFRKLIILMKTLKI